MTNLRELKTLLVFILLVSVASIIALLYYAVNFIPYTNLAMGFLHIGEGASNKWNDNYETNDLVSQKLEIHLDQREQNILSQNGSNIDRSDHAQGLCPETSSALGKLCALFHFILLFRFIIHLSCHHACL